MITVVHLALFVCGSHPVVVALQLAVLSISDHFTRVNVGTAAGSSMRVFGLLFGTQDGRKVDICASVELLCPLVDGKHTLRRDIFDQSVKLYIEVFPKHELLGWYSTGASVQPDDIEIHRAVSGDGLWYLFLNTSAAASQDLPISIHALETRLVDGVARTDFVSHKLAIAMTEMERLTLDHVSSIHSAADSESALKRQLTNAATAVESLSDRIAVLVDYLQRVKAGVVPSDPALLRQLSALCSRLPVVSADDTMFSSELLEEENDTLLLSLLASITKSASSLTDLSRKFDVAYADGRKKGLM